MSLKQRLTDDMKAAMKSGDRERLAEHGLACSRDGIRGQRID